MLVGVMMVEAVLSVVAAEMSVVALSMSSVILGDGENVLLVASMDVEVTGSATGSIDVVEDDVAADDSI